MDNSAHPRTGRDTVHVIGGGLAGLTASATIARAGLSVVVQEQRRPCKTSLNSVSRAWSMATR